MNKNIITFTQSLRKQLAQRCAGRLDWTSILMMRSSNFIQLAVNEIALIATRVVKKVPCNFLVFGLGNDSFFWSCLNPTGQTTFIEDNPDWFRKVRNKYPQLTAHLVNYNTRRSSWEELLSRPELLWLSLPEEIQGNSWDVILVDGPNGWKAEQPGRMKSIYMASKLIKPGGDIFVHDCNRIVEDVYASKFLGRNNLQGSTGRLRHYLAADQFKEENKK